MKSQEGRGISGKDGSKKENSSGSSADTKTLEKYARGSLKMNNKGSKKYKNLRKTLTDLGTKIVDAATKTAETEILLPNTAGFISTTNIFEKTFKLRQSDILKQVDLNTQKNVIDLHLTNFGPYCANYSRNGRYLLFGGRKGHVAVLDCHKSSVGMELQLQETVHDVQYLHNETMFAVAQQKYTYIYDQYGVEIHCMKRHERPFKLDFLPYHYLLTSVGHSGWIKWQDVSIGEYVAGHATGHGPCKVLKHNPLNAISHVGHSNGIVTLWSPTSGKSLVSMFCHKSPVIDLAIDREGRYMSTVGMDCMMKVWDLRKFGCVNSYKLEHPATSIDVSDRNLVAMSVGRTVQILKDPFSNPPPADMTYLRHEIDAPNPALSGGGGVTAATRALKSSVHAHSVKFRPFEDICCVGHSHGLSTIIVPGAGEPNFDSFENNPYMNNKQRRENEVQTLLNKLSPDMIALDQTFIGTIDKSNEMLEKEHRDIFTHANQKELSKKPDTKMRKRGRNKISKKLMRKQKNVVDAQTVKLKEKLNKQKVDRQKQLDEKRGVISGQEDTSGALARFYKKKK